MIESTLSLAKPELQQLNVDKIILTPIPKEDYNEIIDGRSVTFTVPQISGTTAVTAKTIVSSTYTVLEKKESNDLLGGNIAFLFSDDLNFPYTGKTNGGLIDKIEFTTWNPSTSIVDRPPAVSFADLETIDVNTDQRTFADVNLAVTVTEAYPTNTNQGYNYDVPVGFIALDKGWLVLTHPDIVNNIPFPFGLDSGGTPNTSSATTEIHFTDTTKSNLSFTDINIEFKTSIICLVFPNEFFFTTNPTYDIAKNFQEQQNSTFGFDAVVISEIALYNARGEIISIAKLDRPLVKQFNDLVTFNLDINV